MREFFVIFCVATCLIGACSRDVKNGRDIGYPREVYKDANLGSIVMMNDSIAVIFNRISLNESSSKVVNINEVIISPARDKANEHDYE